MSTQDSHHQFPWVPAGRHMICGRREGVPSSQSVMRDLRLTFFQAQTMTVNILVTQAIRVTPLFSIIFLHCVLLLSLVWLHRSFVKCNDDHPHMSSLYISLLWAILSRANCSFLFLSCCPRYPMRSRGNWSVICQVILPEMSLSSVIRATCHCSLNQMPFEVRISVSPVLRWSPSFFLQRLSLDPDEGGILWIWLERADYALRCDLEQITSGDRYRLPK